MKYHALTFDTQVATSNSFNFQGGLLAKLTQFKNSGIYIVVSEIIIREIKKQLFDYTQNAKISMEAARKKAADCGLPVWADGPFGGAEPDVKLLINKRIDEFMHSIGGHILKADVVAMRDLVRCYFDGHPPFGSGKKKNEFPDAIALLTLDRWAAHHGKMILAVSGDQDWQRFANNSTHIDCVPELWQALGLLQKDAKEATEIAAAMLAGIETGEQIWLKEEFDRLLAEEIAAYSINANADSAYDIEVGMAELTLISQEFIYSGDTFSFDIIQAAPDIIVARVNASVRVSASADFSMSIYDSIDKDYTPVGSKEASHEESLEMSILVTFEGFFGTSETRVTEVSISDAPSFIDFGNIEPDFGEYDYVEPDNKEGTEDGDLPF